VDHRAIRTDGPDIDDLQLSAADLLAEDIGEAVVDLGDGRLTRARRRLGALWAQAAPGSAHRSAVAHWLGAVEDDVGAKVGWDERALEAAEAAEDWSVPFAGTGMTLGAMYPELHLELARGYRRLGSSCGALEHLALARNAVEMSGQTGRRDWLEQQIGGLEREVGGLQERGATPEWGFDDEDEPELADLWDDEGTD
jgi:hypothetical protein